MVKLPPIKTATVIAAQTSTIPTEAHTHLLHDPLGLSARLSCVTYNFSLLK